MYKGTVGCNSEYPRLLDERHESVGNNHSRRALSTCNGKEGSSKKVMEEDRDQYVIHIERVEILH